MPRKNIALVARLQEFMGCWVSNPAAKLEFVNLIDAVRQQPTSDHADQELADWVEQERATAKRIGVHD